LVLSRTKLQYQAAELLALAGTENKIKILLDALLGVMFTLRPVMSTKLEDDDVLNVSVLTV